MVREEVRYLVLIVDENGDGKLSEEEIVKNYEIFVGSEVIDYGRVLLKYEEL